MKETKQVNLLENCLCHFGKPVLWPSTIALPVKVDRLLLSPGPADRLIGSQCVATLRADPEGDDDAAGQELLVETSAAWIPEIVAEIAGVSATGRHRSFTLSMDPEAIGEQVNLRKFSQSAGTITLRKVGDAPERRGRPR